MKVKVYVSEKGAMSETLIALLRMEEFKKLDMEIIDWETSAAALDVARFDIVDTPVFVKYLDDGSFSICRGFDDFLTLISWLGIEL